MALLFSRISAGSVRDPEYGDFEPREEDGAFDFPDELSERLHRVHFRGRAAWETAEERVRRLHGEESDRRRDPESLYTAVSEIAAVTKHLAGLQPAPAVQPDVTALEAQVAELQAKLAAAEAGPADTGKPAAEGKPAPAAKTARKPAAAKQS